MSPSPEPTPPAAGSKRALLRWMAGALLLAGASGGFWIAIRPAPPLPHAAGRQDAGPLPAPAPAAPTLTVSEQPAQPATLALKPAEPASADHRLAAEVAAAGDRATLLDLLAGGAEPDQVAARLGALGYVGIAAGDALILRRPGAGESFSDCADCPALVLAPAGEARMEITTSAAKRLVSVAVPVPFAAGVYEVTRAQYRAFATETRRVHEPGCHVRTPGWRLDPALSWQNPGYAQTEADPVACVSWQDAKAYADWLSRRTGQHYRLLSDAEWHHLAGRLNVDPARLCAIGNGADQSAGERFAGSTVAPCRDGFLHTAPVGRFEPSDWGLHDLNGNVWEWVETCAPDASVPDEPFPPPSCRDDAPRILRGGSWADPPAMRALDARLVSSPGIRDQVAGFRIARDVTR